MAGSANSQRIIPLEEGWNDEIKAKVREPGSFRGCRCGTKRCILIRFGARTLPEIAVCELWQLSK
jgi:hypothetical protein